MLRRLRKKLQRIEIWGWCPAKSRYLPYIDFQDSWNFLGSEHLEMIRISVIFEYLVLWVPSTDLDDLWCILKLWDHTFTFWSFSTQFWRGFCQIRCGSLGFSENIGFQMDGSLSSLDGFGWFLVHFEALGSSFHFLIFFHTILMWILQDLMWIFCIFRK